LVYLYNLTLNFILGIVLAKSVKPPAKDALYRKRHITRQRKRKAARKLVNVHIQLELILAKHAKGYGMSCIIIIDSR
jgi:hypothetical protein